MSIRAALDTNVLVSGLISDHSPPRQLVDAWLDGRFVLVTSLYQVEELSHVLRPEGDPRIARRLRLADEEVDLILAALLAQGEVVAGEVQLPGVTRDPKDDPIVACAVEGGADFLVSGLSFGPAQGDRDLLDLGAYEQVRMVTPREFASILDLPHLVRGIPAR